MPGRLLNTEAAFLERAVLNRRGRRHSCARLQRPGTYNKVRENRKKVQEEKEMRRAITVITLLFFSSVAAAQVVPVAPYPPGRCGVPDQVPIITEGTSKTGGDGTTRAFSLWESELCSQYTHAGWWGEALELQLGEGAADYREEIELAVKKWNEALRGWWQDPLIEIIEDRPTNYRLSESFWEEDHEEEITDNLHDGENVIYLKPGDDPDANVRGVAYWQDFLWWKLGADIYINTAREEDWSGIPATSKKIIDVSPSHGAYAFVNNTYEVILHEVGHAVGLGHVPVVGNVMRPTLGTFVDGVADQWIEAMSLAHVIGDLGSEFVYLNAHIKPFMPVRSERGRGLVDFYTTMAELGDLEKALLACVYEAN